jgi:transposase
MTQLKNGSIEFYMHYSVIKEELRVSTDTYYRWVRALIKKGIIKKVRPNMYQLNPACVVKGKGHTLLEEFRNPKLDLE